MKHGTERQIHLRNSGIAGASLVFFLCSFIVGPLSPVWALDQQSASPTQVSKSPAPPTVNPNQTPNPIVVPSVTQPIMEKVVPLPPAIETPGPLTSAPASANATTGTPSARKRV